jgi:hypothetical protein
MAAKDLISLARAKQAIQSITDTTFDTLLTTLITAVSDAIEKYCRRYFISQAFDELYDGDGDRRLMLRQYPIQSVLSVRYRPVTVLKVINNNVSQNQQARVQITSTGVQCWRMASGVATMETLLSYATHPTLQAMATAIGALGNGWAAQVVGDSGQFGGQGDYGLWPSVDLYVRSSYGDPLAGAGIQTSQGNLTARGAFAELKMHTYELQGYQWDARGWLLRSIPYTDPELLHPEDLIWPVGISNFRVQYTAGYSTIPEAVQEACAEWVAVQFFLAARDPGLRLMRVEGSLYQEWTGLDSNTMNPPAVVARLLAPYRRYSVGSNQG